MLHVSLFILFLLFMMSIWFWDTIVTDRYLLGENLDGRTCFRTEMETENRKSRHTNTQNFGYLDYINIIIYLGGICKTETNQI